MMSRPRSNAASAATTGSIFDHPFAVEKELGEFLTGCIINRLGEQQAVPAHTCVTSLPWKSPLAPPGESTPESAYYKIHGSSFAWIRPADIALTTLFRLADANQDGRITKPELKHAVTRSPSSWAVAWHAACHAFPLGSDAGAADFIKHGPKPPSGAELASLILAARRVFVSSATAPPSPSSGAGNTGLCGHAWNAWFWAERMLTLLDLPPPGQQLRLAKLVLFGTLPPQVNLDVVYASIHRGSTLNDMYARPFVGGLLDLPHGEAFWGPIDLLERDVQPAGRLPSVEESSQLHSFAQTLASSLFARARGGSGEEAAALSYIQLQRAFRQDGFLSSVVLPLCLRFPRIGADLTRRWQPSGGIRFKNFSQQQVQKLIQRTPEQLRAFDFERRLGSALATHGWDNPNNGRVLQVLLSAGLFYFRAALACLHACSH